MPYAFVRDESIPAGVRRIMEEQLERARQQLTDAEAPVEKRVHDARKRFKEIRAVLRAVRGPLREQFAVENACFRDAGRELSAVRDAAAVIESLEKLAKVRRLSRATFRRTLEFLRARHDAVPLDALAEHVESVLARLAIARARLDLWPPLDDSFDAIADGLARTYRDGRRAMAAATAGGMPAQYHEWRKRAKEHWYHALLLRDVWPGMMKAWAGAMEDASRALGDHHDLVVLRQILAAESPLTPSATVALLDAIAERQAELEREARRIGRLVYSESPRAWLARIRSAWTAWRD